MALLPPNHSPRALATMSLVLAMLGGLVSLTLLAAWLGVGELAAALAVAGWPGLALLAAAHLPYWGLCGLAWWLLLPAPRPVSVTALTAARWIRDSGSDLLPFTSLGGDLMGARMAVRAGLPAVPAIASTVIDVTLELAAQIAFTLFGLAALLALALDRALATRTLIGLAVAAPALIGFVAAQRIGLFLLLERGARRLARRSGWAAIGALDGLQAGIRTLHGAPARLAVGFVLHLAGWALAAAETWLALHLLGAAPGLMAVLAIESLVSALRSAAFVVPAAIGVQEGGYVVLGPLFGVGPELMLAVALLRRGRDLVLGVPALLAWQVLEGRSRRPAA